MRKIWIASIALFPMSAHASGWSSWAGLWSAISNWLNGIVNGAAGTAGGAAGTGGGSAAAAAPEINGSAAILAVTLVVGIAALLRRAHHNRVADH